MWNELRYTLRTLRKSPGFTLGIILCLGLGMGSTSAIFTVVNAAFMKSLPFADPERLVVLYDTQRGPDGNVSEYRVSPPNFVAWKEQSEVFDGVVAAATYNTNLTGADGSELLRASRVSADFFSTLGVEPLRGRTFSSEEDAVGAAAPVVVLSHSLWQRSFGGDPSILNQTVLLDDQSHTVIGIMPPGFGFPEGLENLPPRALWTPLGLEPDREPQRRWHNHFVFARLAPGGSPALAQSHMNTIAQGLAQDFPDSNADWGVRLRTIRNALVGDEVESALLILLTAVSCLLLIACVNVASMLLARATTRGSEVALRLALGAGKGRLLRLVLTESVLLALLSGLLGLALAWLAVPPLISMSGLSGPAFQDVSINVSVLVFTFAVALLTGVLFGLAPAWKLLDTDLRGVLLEGSVRTGSARLGRGFRSGLVVAEIALLLVLLVDTGLMVKSFQQLVRVDPGFNTGNLLTLRLLLPASRYPEQHMRSTFVDRVLSEVRALPGVGSCTFTTVMPIDTVENQARFSVRDRTSDADEVLVVNHRVVGPQFFETLELPIVEGRPLGPEDHSDAPRVAVVSRHMAKRYWPGQSALGRQVKQGAPDSQEPWLTVVGIAEDVRDSQLDAEPASTWYLPYSQHGGRWLRLVLRADSDPTRLVPAVRQAIWSIDPAQSAYDVFTAEEMVAGSMTNERFSTVLLTLFASVGLVLAVLGVYGVMSYTVRQRTVEIGIRMALGARGRQVRWMILRQGLWLTVSGIVLGLFLSYLVNRLYVNLLLEVGPADPLTVAAMALFLAVVAVSATYVPSRQATRVSPAAVLKPL